MKKLFSFIISAGVAALGVLSLIEGIKLFTDPSYTKLVMDMKTMSAIASIAFGALSIIFLLANIICVFNKKNADKAASLGLASLGFFIIYEGLKAFSAWYSDKNIADINQTLLTIEMIIWIVAFVDGVLLILAAIPVFPVAIRRLFGVLGSIAAIAIAALACFGFTSAPIYTQIIIIGGCVVTVLSLFLSVSLKDKVKE